MVTVLAALCAVLALCVVLLVVEVFGLPRRRRRVLVNLLHDEGTLDALLWSRRGCWLVLKDARMLRTNPDTSTPIDGEVLVDKGHVAFLQVLP